MKLGMLARISITTADLPASLSFYERLGFRRIDEPFNHHPAVLLSDGMIALSLASGEEPHTELTYFTPKLDEQIAWLEQSGSRSERGQEGGEVRFTCSDGLMVRLKGANTTEMYEPKGEPWSKCGRFYELSLETQGIDEAIAFWKRVGFEVEHYDSPKATFATLNDQVIRLGVYLRGSCPHKFKNPTLTYFEPDMKDRIRGLKEDGMIFLEELPDREGKVENAVIESPDGQYFFLFHYDW